MQPVRAIRATSISTIKDDYVSRRESKCEWEIPTYFSQGLQANQPERLVGVLGNSHESAHYGIRERYGSRSHCRTRPSSR